MKISNLIIAFLAIILAFSCKKDKVEDPEPKENQFLYNGTVYELSWGEIEVDRYENELRQLKDGLIASSIILYSKSVYYNNTGFYGIGNAFCFEDIITTTKDIEGEYQLFNWNQGIDWHNYDFEVYPIEEAGLVMECELFFNFNFDEYEGDNPEFNVGEVFITKEGAEYIITYEGQDDRGIPVSLYYKGTLINNIKFN